MAIETVDTLVIGGGQSGLVMSHMLAQRGKPHLVLERHRIAERWRAERWDGLRFQFPNWSVRLPDFPLRHADPDGFASCAEIIDFLTAYADFVAPPIRCGVAVTALRRADDKAGFVAQTSAGPIAAANVVVATGPFQRPMIPDLLPAYTGLFQVHASHYRNPDQLPPGAVLIVGSGASGSQIAEELLAADRRIYLSAGRHRRLPRRYRGHDFIWWLYTMGLDQTSVEQQGPDRTLPLITGADGGHTIDLRDFAARGITLLGRISAMRDGAMDVAPDLADGLAGGDAAYSTFLDLVDAHVAQHGLDLPEEPAARVAQPDPPCLTEPIQRLDPRAAGITAIIWATGYGLDYNWIDVPVLDTHGAPIHRGGITDVPGIYFLGLQWLSKRTSSFLSDVADDATRLADHIADRR